MSKKTITDKSAKRMCALYLETIGYENIMLAGRDEGYDLSAIKNSEKFFFEVKYSSKKSGKFFGTVMLTELYQATLKEENYYFIICRGNIANTNIKDWFFKIFSFDEFVECCTLTTPIFHYHLYLDALGRNTRKIEFKEKTTKASRELIKIMWNDFSSWKKGNNS